MKFKTIKNSVIELIRYQKTLALMNGIQLTSWQALRAGIISTTKVMAKWLVTNPVGWAVLAVGAITSVVGIYDLLTVSVEENKERVEELMSSYESALSAANENAKTVEKLADKYEELSEGVDNLGRNVSLTNDEYEEYNSLVNDIAKMFPEMVKGYTDEGNAILNLKGNVEQLRDAYKEAQQEAYNLLIASGEDSDGNDIIQQWKYLSENDFFNSKIGGNDFKQKAKRDVANLIANSNGNVDELLKELTDVLETNEYDSSDMLSFIQNEIGLKIGGYNRFEGFGNMYQGVEVTSEDIQNIRQRALAVVQTYQSEINSALSDVRSLANAYLMTNSTYSNFDDEKIKNAASVIVNSLDENIASQFENKNDVGEYVQNIVDLLSKNEQGISDALVELFTTDFSELSAEDAKQIVDQYINKIAELLGEDTLELKVRLGFEDYDTIAQNYQMVIHDAATKATASMRGREKQYEYQEIYTKLDEFGKQYSINTQEEIAAFDKALDEAEGDINKAFELYLQDKSEREQLIMTKESLDSVKTYRDELGKLYESLALLRSGETSPTDLYSLIEEFPELSKYVEDLKQGLDLDPSEAVDYIEALQGKIQDLIDIKFDSLKGQFDGVVGEDALRSLAKYSVKTEAVNKAFDTTAEAIKDTSDAFKTLSDSVEYYNKHGYITFDMLENIVKMEPKKLAMLMDENELIKENTEAYKQYLKLQLESYKLDVTEEAQKEHKRIEEAYRNQEISWEQRVKEWADVSEAWKVKYNLIADTEKALKDGKYDGISSSTEADLDWVEVKIDTIAEKIERLKAIADDPFSSWDERSSKLKETLADTEALLGVYQKAKSVYKDKANEVGLDPKYASLIKEGAFKIDDVPDDVDEKTYKKIQEYQKWWDKYQEMLKAEEDTVREINELTKSNFDQIAARFDAELSHFENVASMIEAKLSNAESKGFMATQQYYATLYDVELAKKAELENKLVELNNALNETDFKTDTEAWSELANNIEEVEISIQESTNAMQEFKNEMRQIDWDLFDFARDQESKFMNEADFMIDLLDSAKMFSEVGEITAEGMTTMGLHAQNYNAYLEQSIDYAKELASLQEIYGEDTIDTNVIERRNELLELQQESILSAEAEKDAIIDLVSEGIELQKDAFQGLIDEYTEALDIQKDLYDYQKKNSEQTKKIADLQKRLISLQGDNSDEARAERQRIQGELKTEKESLQEQQYDRYISDQKEILSTIAEDYNTALDAYLDDTAKVISDSIDTANKNVSNIGKTVTKATNGVGYEVKYWNDGKGVLASNFKGVNENIQDNNKVLGDIKDNTTGLIDAQKEAITSSLKDLSANGTIGQTITGIKGVLETISTQIGGIKTGGSNDFGSGGETNLDPIPQSTGGSSSVTFKEMQSTFNKNNLNKDTSVVDFLKSYNIDSSESARAEYYSQMGLPGTYKNSKEQNIAMLNWLKENEDKIKGYASGGFNLKKQMAWTQENGDLEYIIRKSDGAILTRVNPGDMVLNSDASKNLWSMANNPASFFADIVKGGLVVDIPSSTSNGNMVQIDNLSINVPLENVTDVNSFLREFQRNPKVEAVIKDVIASSMTGNNSLSKYRHKF